MISTEDTRNTYINTFSILINYHLVEQDEPRGGDNVAAGREDRPLHGLVSSISILYSLATEVLREDIFFVWHRSKSSNASLSPDVLSKVWSSLSGWLVFDH